MMIWSWRVKKHFWRFVMVLISSSSNSFSRFVPLKCFFMSKCCSLLCSASVWWKHQLWDKKTVTWKPKQQLSSSPQKTQSTYQSSRSSSSTVLIGVLATCSSSHLQSVRFRGEDRKFADQQRETEQGFCLVFFFSTFPTWSVFLSWSHTQVTTHQKYKLTHTRTIHIDKGWALFYHH